MPAPEHTTFPEQGPSPQEILGSSENPVYQELHGADETWSYREMGEDDPTPRQKEERKRRRDSKRSHIMAAAVVVAAVAVLALVPNSIFEPLFEPFGGLGDAFTGGGSDSDVTGSLDVDSVSDDSVWYTVVLEGDDGGSYTVTLTNRFTERSQSFTGDSFTSYEEGLRPGVDYSLTLTDGDGDVLATASFTTERESEMGFHLGSAECTCPEDDLFHLAADLTSGDLVSVTAILEDRYGNTSQVEIGDGIGSYQIPVRSAGLEGDTATLNVVGISESGEETVLYSGVFMI